MRYNENISYLYIDGVFEYRLKQDGVDESEQNIIHVMDDTTRIAQRRIGDKFEEELEEAVVYILDDHLGSSNARLNNTGSIIDRQEYYPFGDTSLRTFSRKRYQYVGKEKDAESGLSYYGARYYAAWTCRFISVDPLAATYPHLTPYNNAGNKVINDYDIDGMQGSGEGTKPEAGNQNKMPIEKNEAGVREVPKVHGEQGKDYRIATVDEAKSAMSNEEKPGFTEINGREYEYVYSKGLTKGNNMGGYLMINPSSQESLISETENEIIEEVTRTEPVGEKAEDELPKTFPIDFIGGESNVVNKEEALKLLSPLADFLINNPEREVLIIGNTGGPGNEIYGNSNEALNQQTTVDGKNGTLRELMIKRANTVVKLLTESLNVSPKQLKFGAGTAYKAESGRNVGAVIKKRK